MLPFGIGIEFVAKAEMLGFLDDNAFRDFETFRNGIGGHTAFDAGNEVLLGDLRMCRLIADTREFLLEFLAAGMLSDRADLGAVIAPRLRMRDTIPIERAIRDNMGFGVADGNWCSCSWHNGFLLS